MRTKSRSWKYCSLLFCSRGFELIPTYFNSHESWHVGKGNEWQQEFLYPQHFFFFFFFLSLTLFVSRVHINYIPTC
jgi:hypothetical protein